MNNRIKEAFDNIHAEDQLKRDTREFLSTYAVRTRKPMRFRRVAAVFASFALILGGLGFYMTPVSAISIDVNPSVELGVNRLDRVVTVDSYNDDGTDLAASVDLKNLNYSDALEVLLSSDAMQPYMTENDGLVSITVIGATEQKSEEMYSRIRSCRYAESPNVECYSGNREDSAAAQKAGMSCGKYREFLKLQSLDSEVTTQDVKDLTMRQIRNRINELSGEPNEYRNGNGPGGKQK